MFEFVENGAQNASIKVVGVGGGGGNAINTMISQGLEGVEFLAANTDMQALKNSLATTKVQLGRELTKGLGAGANPNIGKNAALEDQRILTEMLTGADMVFITAGLGGGTGTGAAPIIAKIAKEVGALTVAVVTKPFAFEGKQRLRVAEQGLQELKEVVDSIITIPNERLLATVADNITMIDAFCQADQVLLQAVKGIANLITIPGLINLDFADVRTVMCETGMALMGTGVSQGEHRAIDAATRAISSPLLEDMSIKGATGVLINITGGPNMTLKEISEASKLIQEEAHDEANIIFGAVIDPNLLDEFRVTVIATGFNKPLSRMAPLPVRRPMVQPHYETTTQSGHYTPPAPSEMTSSSRLALKEDGSTVTINEYSPSRVSASRTPVEEPIKLKDLINEIGLSDFQEDEYDVPAFLRKQAD